MNLKEIRKNKKLTQKQACEILKISLRSYKTYENDETKFTTNKYKLYCDKLSEFGKIDYHHVILSIETIKEKVNEVFQKYDINFCYLFGSYAKNCARENSDIDLIIDSPLTPLYLRILTEDLNTVLCKKIDILKVNQLEQNRQLLVDVLKNGIKIYG